MKCLVTGAAGFIGSTLVDRLLTGGDSVVAYDNFSTGFREFLSSAQTNQAFCLVEGDIRETDRLAKAMSGCEIVFHLAANADIRGGIANPSKDIEQNTMGTFSVLQAMRSAGCHKIAFASSSAVYGDAATVPTPENVAMPVQISFYGASKLAGEGLISSFVEAFAFQAWVFRFVSVLGPRYPHGHVFDFVKQLRSNPERLRILGDGCQKKSYMHVEDCVTGILLATTAATAKYNLFNLGLNEYAVVNQSVSWITESMKIDPVREYTGGSRGWVGDSPFIWLDTTRIASLGWCPKHAIRDAIIETAQWLNSNSWILERR